MSLAHRLRTAAFDALPGRWRPVAEYYHLRARGLLDREIAWLTRQLPPGARAIDVGANAGVYTHAFARCGALVEAFEPQPACLPALREYERQHHNVRVHGIALGATSGGATLRVPVIAGTSVSGWASLREGRHPSTDYAVEVRTLDSYAFESVAVLKVDVEGGELEVLAGARRTLERCRPVLLVELERRHLGRPVADAFAAIAAMGYRGLFLLPDGRERPVAEFSSEVHQIAANADRPHVLYVYNFLFTPVEQSSAFSS